jgi:hypothetical protein
MSKPYSSLLEEVGRPGEYIDIMRRFTKWHHPSRNLQVGDIVLLQEDNLIPTKWPLGRIVTTYPGKDNLVTVVTIKTSRGVYKRPVTKIALLLPVENWTLIIIIIIIII